MIATSPDGQWAVVRRGREVSLLANAAGPATSRLELPTEDADLVIVGPPSVLAIVTREPAEDGGAATGWVLLHQPPYLDPVARLELEVPMRLAAVTGPRLVLVSLDGKAVSIVRVAGRALSAQPLVPGSPIEFAVGLERNQVLFGLWRKLEAWDAVSCRPLFRMQLQLPPPPRTIGPAHGHLWAVRPGGEDVLLCRLSDGRPFQHSVGAPIDEVVSHPASPLLILATARGLVRLHCFAHTLTAIDAPWHPGMSLAQLVVGDDISLVGGGDRDDELWRVPVGGAGAPAIVSAAAEAPIVPVATATDELPAMRESTDSDASDASDATSPAPAGHAPESRSASGDAFEASWPPRRERLAERADPPAAGSGEADGNSGPGAGEPPWPRARGRIELAGPPPRHRIELAESPARDRIELATAAHDEASAPSPPPEPPRVTGTTGITGITGIRGLRARPVEPREPIERGDPPGSVGIAGGADVRAATPELPAEPRAAIGWSRLGGGARRPDAAATEVRGAEQRDRNWREPLAAYAAELLRGSDAPEVPAVAPRSELEQLVHRLGLAAGAQRALVVLYGLYLVGEPALSIARLAHALHEWTEPLGRGELVAHAMVRRRGGQIALRGAVTDLLDGVAPRAIRVAGTAAPPPRPGVRQLARAGRSEAALEAALVAQLDRIAVIVGPAARAVLEAALHGATAVAFEPPPARPAPWPRDGSLVVIAAPDPPGWVAELPSL